MLLFAGCATPAKHEPPPKPLTQEEIIQMAKAGTPDTDIIQRIQATGTVYRLSSGEILHLHENGVSNAVIDFMIQDCLKAVKWQQQTYWQRYYEWYSFGPHYYWTWPPHVTVRRNP